MIGIGESFGQCQVASSVEMELWFLKDYVAAAKDWIKLYTISAQSIAKTHINTMRALGLWHFGRMGRSFC